MRKQDYKLNITECCKYSEAENLAVAQIKKWIFTLNRDADCCSGEIAISQHSQENEGGLNSKHTLICICDTSSPVIKIDKPVIDITLVDILNVYSKINSVDQLIEELI
jgi:hypothetical protein